MKKRPLVSARPGTPAPPPLRVGSAGAVAIPSCHPAGSGAPQPDIGAWWRDRA